MNQFRVPVIRFHQSTLVISLPWLAVGLVLAAATGWTLSGEAISTPTLVHRLIAALLCPFVLVMSLSAREAGRTWVLSRHSPQQNLHRRLYLNGSAPAGYRLALTPGSEIRQSLIAPVISFVLAGTFLAPMLIISAQSVAGQVLLGTGLLNLMLGALNVLPAMPFDGGAILRAIFWFLHDNHTSGTRVTFLYGQLIASGLLGFGIVLLSWRTDLIVPGLWCVVLGWMVIRASRSELMRAHLIERSGLVRASDAVAGLNPTIRAADGVAEALDILLEQKDNGPGLVRDRDRFVGMLTLASVRRIPRAKWRELSVQDVMTPLAELADSPPEARLLEALQIQSDLADDSVVVRHQNGEVAGLINSEISPRLLLRRAEERGFDLAQSEPTRNRSIES